VTKHQMPVQADQSRLWGHVASLPCQRPDCYGLCGPVQVSHSNSQRDGKGMGLKAYPWRVAALGVRCHQELDSGKHLSKQERREQWDEAHRATIGELFRLGLVRPV
jgi:hypothetical protein